MRLNRWLVSFALVASSLPAAAQTQPKSPYYSRLNTFGVFAGYSNDSSPILLGVSENRKLLSLGVSYNRALWQGPVVNMQYSAEFMPLILESDPVLHVVLTELSPQTSTSQSTTVPVTACRAGTGQSTTVFQGVTYEYNYTDTCSHRWTAGAGMTPIGFQWNFLPRQKIQPVATGRVGFMYSTQPIPVPGAGAFNFIVDIGAGFELFRSRTRSIRAEYRYHHISNDSIANRNPGIDNEVIQVTYLFGR